MQQTEHMKGPEDELIAHIKESLTGYEEEYVPGSWENFNKIEEKRNTNVLWLWRLSSAAAVILIAGAAIIFFTNKTTDLAPVQSVQHAQKEKASPAPKGEEKVAKEAGLPIVSKVQEQIAAVKQNKETAGDITALQPAKNMIPVVSTETVIEKTNPVVPLVRVPDAKQDVAKAETKPVTTENKTNVFQEFLNNETRKNQGEAVAKSSAPRTEDKWEMGLVVSPSFGNTKKLNMGYGVSMGYALTDKISLNSGISYSEMAASRSLPVPMVSTAIAQENKNLESIEAKVTGIDIPLELKYRLSKNFYANVGVSAFAVINQKQSNSYVQEKLMESPASPNEGLTDLKTYAVNERVVEQAPESEIKEGKYIGFYNFSFGYKQKISKNKAVSIEPFMKVPMKEVSKENLRLIGTGVRLKLDF